MLDEDGAVAVRVARMDVVVCVGFHLLQLHNAVSLFLLPMLPSASITHKTTNIIRCDKNIKCQTKY